MERLMGALERGKAPAVAPSGGGYSMPRPQLLCISLHETDKIRVMNIAESSIAAFRNCIQSSWPYGIQSEGLYGISYQFKLRGRPWYGSGEQSNAARLLMAGIFGFLLRAGWRLKISADVSKWKWDKDTLYFKQDAHPDPHVQVCAMSFNMGDKIRVIGGPQEVAHVVRSCVHNFWHLGLQRESLYSGSPEFKLGGYPWQPHGTDTMQTRMFVGQLIEALDHAGWEVYASIDISQGKGGNDSSLDDLDSWILRTKVPAMSVGVPAPQALQQQFS